MSGLRIPASDAMACDRCGLYYLARLRNCPRCPPAAPGVAQDRAEAKTRVCTRPEVQSGSRGTVARYAKAPRNRVPRPQNKAEAEWCRVLLETVKGAAVTPHGITLVFPDGDRYTPDVIMVEPLRGTVIYEVKAGYRGPGWEQGVERFKRARAAFPWLKMYLAEKRQGVWYVDGEPWRA